MLGDIIVGDIDILLISEIKVDFTFPLSNFKIPVFLIHSDRIDLVMVVVFYSILGRIDILRFFLVWPSLQMWNAFLSRLSLGK